LAVWGQQSKPAARTSRTARTGGPPPLKQLLNLFRRVSASSYFHQNQTPTQQASDEGTCFAWAKTNTGIDPMARRRRWRSNRRKIPPPPGRGRSERRRARGGWGAAIGAIAGDAGKGAAIGATVGVMSGGAQRRNAKQQAAAEGQQAQANAAAQSQAISAQQKATFNKGFSACMEGKGYTSK
jgi:hypothetical protein